MTYLSNRRRLEIKIKKTNIVSIKQYTAIIRYISLKTKELFLTILTRTNQHKSHLAQSSTQSIAIMSIQLIVDEYFHVDSKINEEAS